MPGRGQKHDLSSPPIVVVENVQCYRECAAHYLTPKDVVIEIGAAQGCTTSVIAQYAGKVVAVDKSPFNVGVAKERYPSIRFYEMDAMDISGLMELHKQYPFNKVFLDISGSQPVGPLATLLEKYERAFPGIDLFVVKSYRLKKLVGASTVFPEEVRAPSTLQLAQPSTFSLPANEHPTPFRPTRSYPSLNDVLVHGS